MKIIRWIISTPIAIALFIGLSFAFAWLLGWLYKILYYVVCWGSRFDVPAIFDFQSNINDFKSFIFVTCLSTLLAAGCAGFIGGAICPPNNPKATTWLFSIVIIPVVLLWIVSFWSSEHWFYSIIWIIDMILAAILFVGAAFTAQDND